MEKPTSSRSPCSSSALGDKTPGTSTMPSDTLCGNALHWRFVPSESGLLLTLQMKLSKERLHTVQVTRQSSVWKQNRVVVGEAQQTAFPCPSDFPPYVWTSDSVKLACIMSPHQETCAYHLQSLLLQGLPRVIAEAVCHV